MENESTNGLQPVLDGLKQGKTISLHHSESSDGCFKEYYYWVRWNIHSAEIQIETKDVIDRGYPDIEFFTDAYTMTWEAFEIWLKQMESKTNKMKVE
jgi:hypothetical protein